MSVRKRLRKVGAEKQPTLNLVSLMDIFTILVFFLMVNANEVEILETSTAIKLPDSTSELKPEERITIEINNEQMLLQGSPVASFDEVLKSSGETIDVLQVALANLERKQDQKSVTIMGDEALPYEVLKRVMTTCQAEKLTHIALAVNQIGTEEA